MNANDTTSPSTQRLLPQVSIITNAGMPGHPSAQRGRPSGGAGEHDLGKTFRFKPRASTFLALRTAARGMAAAAETHREVLLKHGLSQSVLDEFVRMLDQFDEAVALGNDGRTAHVGASRELRSVAPEIVRTVRVMDGRNRQRFAEDGQLLGSWISASRVLGTPRPGGEPERGTPVEGEVRPAA